MDTTIDHSVILDVKPPITSLPIATFPASTSDTARSRPTTKHTSPIPSSIKKTSPSSTSSGAAGRRRSSSSSGVWSGVRPVERQLMRPWLIEKIDKGTVEGLEWVDAAHTRFRIPWKHGSRHGWRTEQDACLFMLWAQHTGRYRGSEAPDAKRWKANFRCALNSLPDVRELKALSQTRGQNAFRVYEFLNERKPKGQHARMGSSRTKSVTHDVKTEIGLLPSSPANTTLDNYPVIPTSCSTSGSTASSLEHQNHTNEEPVDHTSYSQSPVPSPTDSYGSTSSSDDPYSPCSPPPPPPAHQHTPSNASRNWMLDLENESYRSIFNTSSFPTPIPSTTASTWVPPAPACNTNSSAKPDVTSTSSPSHAFPASSPDYTVTSSTSSFPTTPLVLKSWMLNNGKKSSQVPHQTMDIGQSSYVDYDSGLESPSSGPGSPLSSHSDMDYTCSDDGNHTQEVKSESLKTCQDQGTFQEYHHYQQFQQQHLQRQQQHSPTSSHSNYTLHQMIPAAINNRQHLQHNPFNNHNNNNNTQINDYNNNQFNLQASQLAGDYGLVEAIQNAFGTIITEMASLDPEDIESVLSATPGLNVVHKTTGKAGTSLSCS